MVAAAWSLVTCGDSGTEPPSPAPPANRAPEVRGPIPDQMLALGGSAATVDVSDNFADPDGDALSYAVSSADGRVVSASVSGAMVTVRPEGVGTTTVRVTASDPGGLTATLSFAVTVTGWPDLVVEDLWPDSVSVPPGGSFEYAVTIRNRGEVTAAATKAATFASADSVVTTSDEVVGEASNVPTLGPGQSASRVATFAASLSASPGTAVWVGECVDPVDGESDTGNNCSAAIKVTVTARPDLVVGVSPDSVAVAPGGSFAYAVEVQNRGNAAAPATTVGAFLSADPIVTISDELVGQTSRVPALDPGEAVRGTASMIVSRSSSPGTVVWVGECVAPVEGESDTGNNCSTAIKVTVLGTGGHRAARSAVAPPPGGPGSKPSPAVVAAVVGRLGRIGFRPVARGLQRRSASPCWRASSDATLCRSPGEFVLVGSGIPR